MVDYLITYAIDYRITTLFEYFHGVLISIHISSVIGLGSCKGCILQCKYQCQDLKSPMARKISAFQI